MGIINGISVLIAPFIGIMLILADYWKNKSADKIQRILFTLLIATTAMSMVTELVTDAFSGVPGRTAYFFMYAACFFFFIFQQAALSCAAVFLDYSAFESTKRVKAITLFLLPVFALNIVFLVINIPSGFYFSITADNLYARGDFLLLRLLCAYYPVAVIFMDLLLMRKSISKAYVAQYISFTLPACAAAVIDLYVTGFRLLWPLFSLSIVLAYIFLIRSDSRRDGLTGANNRRSCDDYLANMSKLTKRKPCAFFMIDIDHFKTINDRFGHSKGDEALKDVVQILNSSVRKLDFVGRYGGDEFVIYAPNCDKTDNILSRISYRIEEFNSSGGRPYTLELSIGHGVYHPNDTRSPVEFLNHVDRRMYQLRDNRRAV